ncbi:hypothetical protein [Pontibacterium sp.]|uniref:hypothetical protein n=1 Tax=Pontibacterium sp. TaxID=2036026 RepID=UPI003563CE93
MVKPLEWSKCSVCSDDEAGLSNYYGSVMCDRCITLEETTDWDAFEEAKRNRIAEENEY